jgi:hypothetical protein
MPIIMASAEEFIRLRSSQNAEEYLSAAHGKASDEVWLEVIKQYPEYARWVAHNKTISVEIIRVLATNPDENVRFQIAAKRKTPPDVLWTLAKDENDSVRNRVVHNAKTPKEILEFLLNDSWREIQEAAQRRLAEMEQDK